MTHGDFSPRNVLNDGHRLVLIDFDRLQMASPARDLAYWGAWVWATQRLRGDQPSWDIGDELTERYVNQRDAEVQSAAADEIWSGLNFHRASALARIVHGWSALQHQPDIADVLIGDAHRILGRD